MLEKPLFRLFSKNTDNRTIVLKDFSVTDANSPNPIRSPIDVTENINGISHNSKEEAFISMDIMPAPAPVIIPSQEYLPNHSGFLSNISYHPNDPIIDGADPYLFDAARLFAEKGNCSIGAIQRYFKLGFNRAARIMDQLEDIGVVGPEQNTAPRRVLVSPEGLERMITIGEFHINHKFDLLYIPHAETVLPTNERISLYNNKFDYMEGHDFEHFCADILRKNKFTNIETTPGSGDQGIDILAKKDGVKYGIQCKCYSSNISNRAIQEAFSGAKFYDCHVPVVLTNRYFTKSAKELAKKTGVLLWDRDKLNELIENVSSK